MLQRSTILMLKFHYFIGWHFIVELDSPYFLVVITARLITYSHAMVSGGSGNFYAGWQSGGKRFWLGAKIWQN